MNFFLNGKIALVTGASKGIGRAIAESLALEGAKVGIFARTQSELEEVAQGIAVKGGQALPLCGDATSEKDIMAAVSQMLQVWGRIDILVNNVGYPGRFVTFDALEVQEWHDLFNLNVMSGVHFCRAVIPCMKEQSYGRIIFISSESGVQPDAEMPHYNVTKAAQLALSKSLANDLGQYGITVNSVLPGPTPTPAWEKMAQEVGITLDAMLQSFANSGKRVLPAGRLGRPEDIASAVTFLASDQASWVTGASWRVDGGSVKCVI